MVYIALIIDCRLTAVQKAREPTAEQLYARVIDRLDAVTRVYYKLTFIAQVAPLFVL